MKSLLLTLLLVGCVKLPDGAVPIQGDDAIVMQTTMATWSQAIGPIGSVCLAQSSRMHVVELKSPCGYGRLRGCFSFADGLKGSLQPELKTPVIELREDSVDEPYRRALIRHEVLHWLSACSFNTPDPYHTNNDVWVLDTP